MVDRIGVRAPFAELALAQPKLPSETAEEAIAPTVTKTELSGELRGQLFERLWIRISSLEICRHVHIEDRTPLEHPLFSHGSPTTAGKSDDC
ncbi:MAG: hypothetical protein IFK92_10995 [Acidobacteria bacterium]|nr:hypothetical protein [Candidatus Sulfomarinibacter kjeldsenii]